MRGGIEPGPAICALFILLREPAGACLRLSGQGRALCPPGHVAAPRPLHRRVVESRTCDIFSYSIRFYFFSLLFYSILFYSVFYSILFGILF